MSETLEWLRVKAIKESIEELVASARSLDPESRQVRLLRLLNDLENACLALPEIGPDPNDDRSPNRHEKRREQVASAFPEFGFYHSMRPSPVLEAETPCVSDAVDDLAEILTDLDAAIWCDAKGSVTNAIWEAKFAYEHHLGAHLASLRSHLYQLRFFGR